MAKVLGKVTGEIAALRGPDALHRIRVPEAWLQAGATIEVELPRNLTCASCEGGGCDKCDRSGAVSLRGRKEPLELLQVTLPPREAADVPPSSGKRGLVVRVPGRGGMPKEEDDRPRGVLLLSVRPGLDGEKEASLVELREAPRPVPQAIVPTVPPATTTPPRAPLGIPLWGWYAAAAVAVAWGIAIASSR